MTTGNELLDLGKPGKEGMIRLSELLKVDPRAKKIIVARGYFLDAFVFQEVTAEPSAGPIICGT